MLNRNDCINYAQNFVDRVIAKGIEIKYAMLFGSYAKNTQDENSDVDILLVGEKFSGVGFIDNRLIASELIEFDEVQVKTYSTDDFMDSDPLIEEIKRTALNLRIN